MHAPEEVRLQTPQITYCMRIGTYDTKSSLSKSMNQYTLLDCVGQFLRHKFTQPSQPQWLAGLCKLVT